MAICATKQQKYIIFNIEVELRSNGNDDVACAVVFVSVHIHQLLQLQY